MLTIWELTKWELVIWEVREIDGRSTKWELRVRIDELGVDQVRQTTSIPFSVVPIPLSQLPVMLILLYHDIDCPLLLVIVCLLISVQKNEPLK